MDLLKLQSRLLLPLGIMSLDGALNQFDYLRKLTEHLFDLEQAFLVPVLFGPLYPLCKLGNYRHT